MKEVKREAKEFYDSVGIIRCIALESEVHFTSDGFHHLRYDGARAERSKKVQENKMRCLKPAVEILKKTTTIQEFRESIQPIGKRDKSGFRKTKRVKYYAFVAIIDLKNAKRIKVIVRQIGDGKIQFWSVMPFWSVEKISTTQKIRNIGSRILGSA